MKEELFLNFRGLQSERLLLRMITDQYAIRSVRQYADRGILPCPEQYHSNQIS